MSVASHLTGQGKKVVKKNGKAVQSVAKCLKIAEIFMSNSTLVANLTGTLY